MPSSYVQSVIFQMPKNMKDGQVVGMRLAIGIGSINDYLLLLSYVNSSLDHYHHLSPLPLPHSLPPPAGTHSAVDPAWLFLA